MHLLENPIPLGCDEQTTNPIMSPMHWKDQQIEHQKANCRFLQKSFARLNKGLKRVFVFSFASKIHAYFSNGNAL
jgi:hypothetical protein